MNIFDFLNDLYTGLLIWLDNAFTAISAALDLILDSLNPINVIHGALVWIEAFLPPAIDVRSVTGPFISALEYLQVYLQALDYFVNLPMFMFVVSIILGIESGLLSVRIWRFLRSFVT